MYADDKILNELDIAWDKIKNTISSGDFRSFKSVYHRDAVLVNGISNKSYPIKKAFGGWKQGFMDTKAGLLDANLELKFSRRIFDSSTAHETGIFVYSYTDPEGNQKQDYIHFQALLLKGGGGWKIMMEYQKSKATREEWEALAGK